MARKSDIRLRRSAISGSVPGGADLNLGELALNTADGAVFVKNGAGNIITVSHDGILHYDEANSRIGINTTNPTYKFHVGGSGSSYLAGGIQLNSTDKITIGNPNQFITAVNDTSLTLATDGSASLTILDNGNVGIGTSSPTFKLHAYHPTSNLVSRFESGDAQVWIELHDSDSGSYGALLGHEHAAGDLFKVANAAVHTKFVIKNDGNVGIGTSSPARRLTVQGDSGDNLPARFIGGANTTHGSIEFQDPTTTADYKVVIGSKTDDLYFQSGGNEKARLTSGGFLGIGTGSTADTPIHVYRASGISGIIPQLKLHANTSDNTGTQGSSIDFVASSDKTAIGSRIIAARVGAGAHQNLKFHTARDTFAMIIDENQNVGIGVADPGARLRVNGAIVSEGGSFASAQEGSITDVGLVVQKNNYIYSDDGTYLRRIIGTTTAGLIEIGQGGTALITDIILKPGSTGNIRFFGSGSEDVRINSSGNMGVGTITPVGNFVVSNSEAEGIEFFPGNFTNGNVIQNYNRATNAYVSLKQTAADYRFNIGTAEKVRIDTLGRLLVTDNGYNGQFGNNIGGNSDKFVAVSSATAGETVAYHLGVNDTARNSRVKLFMTDDAATANRAFGIAQTWSSGGAMPFILTMGNNERLKVSTTGTVTFNNAYTFPASIGAAGQILKVPATGTDLIWGADAGGGSATLLTDSDGDTLIQVEEGTDDDIIRFDTAGQQRMTILSNGKVGIGNTATTILHVEDDNANSFGTTTDWTVQTSDSLALVNSSNSDGDQITSFYMRASGNGGNVSARQILRNTSSGSGEIHWQMRDAAHTNTTNDKMILKSSGQLGIGISPSGAKLHIQDDSGVQLRVQSSVSTGDFYKSGNDLVIANNAMGVVKFWNNSVERIRLDGSGHVRIGGAAAANASGSRQTLHIDSVTNGAAIRLSQNDSGALFRYDTTNGLKIGTITNEILTLQTNDTDAVQINTAQDVTIFGSGLTVDGASPYIRGTGTGAMRIKHTAGQTMHIRPDENGQVSFYEGSSGNHVYLMTATPTTNSSTNDSSYLSFQTRSKKADGTSQSATASIRARTLNVSNNQSELLFTGMSQHRFANDVVVEGNITVNGTQTILNTATLSVDDLNITVADGAADAAAANGAGLTVDGANATWTYSSGDDAWASNKHAQFYTGGGTGTLSVGRTSDQAIRLYADDNYNRIFAFQDADSDTDHFFDLVRSFQGTGKADMRFMSGTAVHAVLDKAGNFGINTAAPSNKLEVNGIACIISGLRLGSSASGEGLIRHGGTTSYGVGITTGALSSTNIKLFVAHENDGGGVGIGTTAPSDKLHVIGNTKIEQTSNLDAILRLNPNSGTIGSNYRWELVGRNSAENYNFQIRQGATPYLTINNSIGGGAGDVGIGTTNPTSHINTGSFFKPDSNGKFLTLNGGANGSFIMLESSTTTDNDQIGGIYWNRTQGQGDAHKQVAGIDVVQTAYGPNNVLEGGTLRFFTKGSGSGVNTPRMVIKDGGNVGIGTAAPSSLLNIKGADANFIIQDTNTGYASQIASLTLTGSTASGAARTDVQHKIKLNGDNLTFVNGTNDDERMRIEKQGNVGIGTNSPIYKLSVSGNIGITDGVSTGLLAMSGGNYYMQNTGAYSTVFQTTGTERMRITAAGRLGIGTTSPASNLHVDDSTGITVSDTDASATTTKTSFLPSNNGGNSLLKIKGGNYNHFVTYETAWNNFEYARLSSSYNTSDTIFELKKSASDGSTAAITRISTGTSYFNGNVGIGEANPNGKLVVRGANYAANQDGGIIIQAGARDSSHWQSGFKIKSDGSGNARTAIDATTGATAGTLAERISIDTAGKVGIGTTSPSEKLHVAGNQYIDGNLQIKSAGVGNAMSILQSTSGNIVAKMGESAVGHGFLTLYEVSVGDVIKFDANADSFINRGKLGIGTNTPDTKLDITTSGVEGLILNQDTGSALTSSRLFFKDNVRINGMLNVNGILEFRTGMVVGSTSGTKRLSVSPTLVKSEVPLRVEEYQIDTTTSSTAATTQVAIHTFPIADFRSARFTIQITNSTDSTYHSTEILAIHDGTTANITEFGEVHTGSSVEATFDADVSSGNFRLLATPASADNMVFKVVCHSLTV